MKNLIYAGVIVVCVAIVLVMLLRGGNEAASEIPDAEMTWVTCIKCNEGYEMSLKAYLQERNDKSLANPSAAAMRAPVLLTCQKCGQDGILKAYKCEKCGLVFRENSVPNDLPDRCPKCKHSATLAKREANKAAQQN
jgi:phage FluMu protein Com